MPATEQTACFITDILPQITGMLNKALWIKLRSQINDTTPAFRFQVMQQNETFSRKYGCISSVFHGKWYNGLQWRSDHPIQVHEGINPLQNITQKGAVPFHLIIWKEQRLI
jgi:hypothetical protein